MRLVFDITLLVVTLEQGEYHLARNGSDKLARYKIVLPIKGDYLH
jgi:hypothetical protein